jgi:chromosome partitioning protein
MITVAIANQKGGVGKTTLSLALAAAGAQRDLSVLVVDADPQANATDTLVPDFDPETAPTLYDALDGGGRGAAETQWERVSLVPGDLQSAKHDEWGIAAEQRLRIALDGVDAPYDLVLVDCPRALGALTAAAMVYAGNVLVVAEPTKDSLRGVSLVLDTADAITRAYRPDLRTVGVIVNRIGRTKARSVRAEQLRESLGDLVWEPGLPEWSAIARVTETGEQLQVGAAGRAGEAAWIISRYLDRLIKETSA